MKRSLFQIGAVTCALLVSACNGKLAVLTQPVDASGNPVGSEGTAGSHPGDPDHDYCPELALQGGGRRFDTPPIACGACRCDDGQVSCQSQDCLSSRPIHRCLDVSEERKPAEIGKSTIYGDRWLVEVRGHGGCGGDDFDFCYVIPSDSRYSTQNTYPREAEVRVQNITTAEECDSMVFQELSIDLAPLAVFRSDQGGLVNTWVGTVQVGDLTCSDRSLLANSRLNEAEGNVETECETAADCEAAWVATACGNGCLAVAASHEGFADLRAQVDQINADICGGFDTECGAPLSSAGACDAPREAICLAGTCGSR